MGNTQAISEIKSDAMRLVQRHLIDAIDRGDWMLVDRLATQLHEIAERGIYHGNNQKARDIAAWLAKTGSGIPSEREAR